MLFIYVFSKSCLNKCYKIIYITLVYGDRICGNK